MSSEDSHSPPISMVNRIPLTNVTNTSTPPTNGVHPLTASTPRRSSAKHGKPQLDTIVTALGETNKLLTSVVKRMEKQEERMEHIENKLDSSISSSSSSTPVRNRQKDVPLQVRVSVVQLGVRPVYILQTYSCPDNNRSVLFFVLYSVRQEGYMLFLRKKIQTISRGGLLELGMTIENLPSDIH